MKRGNTLLKLDLDDYQIEIRGTGSIIRRVKRKKYKDKVKTYIENYFVSSVPKDVIKEMEKDPNRTFLALAIVRRKKPNFSK